MPGDLLCIQYTSGTTATPKGVMLTNAAYLRTANYVAHCQRLTPSTRFISAAPFFHCSGTMHAITVCLLAGCTLDAMSTWDPQRFLDETERRRCDASHMIYFRDVLALGAPRAREQLASLRVAHGLGTREYLLRIRDELGIEGISNLYGMTETAGQYTMWFPDDAFERRISANGRPQPAIGCALATDRSTVAAGAVGEIRCRARPCPGCFTGRRPTPTFTPSGCAPGPRHLSDAAALHRAAEGLHPRRRREPRAGESSRRSATRPACSRSACWACNARLDECRRSSSGPAADWPRVLLELAARSPASGSARRVYGAHLLPQNGQIQRPVLRDWTTKADWSA
jgi:fatty-acyl-CoA synthase